MSDLDQFTSTDLTEMHAAAYQRAMAQFEQADMLFGKMAGLAYPSPAYAKTRDQARVALAAGAEAHELLRAIGAEIRTRQANANA